MAYLSGSLTCYFSDVTKSTREIGTFDSYIAALMFYEIILTS